MFWDKSYTPSQNIEALLQKENSTVEEFLDDDDILHECRSQKKAIINYFTRVDVVKRLVELITTEPPDDLPMAQRYRHANMACEILTFGLPSLEERLLSDENILNNFYSYLENEPPLNPLLSSFFSKTFSMLFTKKAEQEWFLYQQMCLKLLEYVKSQNNFLDLICKHFTTPVIPDLLMQMMRNVEGGPMKRSLYEWLAEEKLIERLIAIIGNPQDTEKHANAAEFFCDLIQQGRSMRITEQDNEGFEPTFDGSNPILQRIEEEGNIEALLNVIMEPNALESAVVSGISVVLMLLKPVVFTDEGSSDGMEFIKKRELEIREQILSTVIRVIAPRLNDFIELLVNPQNKPDVVNTAAEASHPFGMTRLQICRFFTVLLQTKHEEILKAVCETKFFETLLTLFKQYCWNNFLHSEVEKCLQLVFYTQLSNNNNIWQGSTNGTFIKFDNNAENTNTFFDKGVDNIEANNEIENLKNDDVKSTEKEDVEMKTDEEIANEENETASEAKTEREYIETAYDPSSNTNAMETDDVILEKSIENGMKSVASDTRSVQQVVRDDGELDDTQVHVETAPSTLQTHVIVKCNLISKLIDCWKHNTDTESAEKGRRLGYMGHLIKIFKHITDCISESEHIGALIESNFSDEIELKLWQSITNQTDGDFTKALATQSKKLANYDVYAAGDFSQHSPKDFLSGNNTWDNRMSSNTNNNLLSSDFVANDLVYALEHMNDVPDDEFGCNLDEDDYDDDNNENNTSSGDGNGGIGGIGIGSNSSLFGKNAVSTSTLQAFGVTNNPWDNMDPFSDLTANSNSTPWAADFNSDNFADFDSHFSSFANDLGESLVSVASINAESTATSKENTNNDNESNNDDSSGDETNKKQQLLRSEQQQQQQISNTDNDTVSGAINRMTASAAINSDRSEMSYDNNANVEKNVTLVAQEIGEFADGTSGADDLNDVSNETTLATALVRTLQSVMQDTEDDYEDDEGMWTKPLGGSAVNAQDDESDEGESKPNKIHFTNGPSNLGVHENENAHNLNETDGIDDPSTIATPYINDSSENIISATICGTKRTNSSTSLEIINDIGCNATAMTTAKTPTANSNTVEPVPTTT